MDGSRFDHLAKQLGIPTDRRRGLLALGASLVGGALGSLALADDAEGKKGKRNTQITICFQGQTQKTKKKGFQTRFPGATVGACTAPTTAPTTTTTPPPGTTTTQPPPPNASQLCLAAGNQCGTFAAQQGSCRFPAVADNQAGLLCTSNTAGNPCTASTQCGPGTRCAGLPVANCRVVIP